MPAAPMGAYTVRAVAGSRSASAGYTIVPRIKVMPGDAETGDPINVSLRGYAKRESVRIRWLRDSTWVTLATVTTSRTGSANVYIDVPAWAKVGSQKVRGDGWAGRAQTNAFVVSGTTNVAGLDEVETAPALESTPTPTPAPAETPAPIVESGPIVDDAVPDSNEAPVVEATEPPTPTVAPAEPVQVGPYAVVAGGQSDNSAASWVVYDGDPSTYWVTNEAAVPPSEAHVVFDLGAVYPVGSVRWLFAAGGLAAGMRVEISGDGASWTLVAAPGNAEPGVWQEAPVGVEARFVRFFFANPEGAAHVGGLAEVEVWP